MAAVVPHLPGSAEIPHSVFPPSSQFVYADPGLDEGGTELQGRITESALAKAIGDGAAIQRAVVVEASTTGAFVLYLRLSDRAGYICVAKRRPSDGPKDWSDFRTLQRFVRKLGFNGVFCVFPESHSILLRFGIGAELPAE